jgi:hypothetical protein
VISSISASPKRFRTSGKKAGTTFRYRLSEAASVVFSLDARSTGRKSGKKCVKPTRANRKKKHCTRFTPAGRFVVASRAGANSHHFSGRLFGKKLRPGSYRVTVVATDAAHNRSKARAITVKVVAR